MILSSLDSKYYITDSQEILDIVSPHLLTDPNCLRSFPCMKHGELPEGIYLQMYSEDEWQGAMVLMQDPKQDNRVQLHILWHSEATRKYIRQLCELCTLYCQLNNYEPHTIVRDIPELQYMVNFITRTGAPSIKKDGFHIFYKPRNWKPRFLSQVRITY